MMPTAAKKKKKRGGPIRDAERTRARILEKATRLFAISGFDGTSVAQIVDTAEVTKRLLFYYFGDKQSLYREVFISQWGELKAEFDRALAESAQKRPDLTTRESLVEMLSVMFDFMASHRSLLRLMMWEGLEGGAISRTIWKEVRGPLFMQAEALVEQARKEGLLAAEVDPAHYIVSFLGVVTFYLAYAHTMPDMIGPRPLGRAALAHRKEQVMALQERLFIN